MSVKVISISLVVGVVVAVTAYASFILYMTWPISGYTIGQAGVFGDSFGILTSLFSGLAFSGMIITILLQRDELKLQRKELSDNRKEFAKSAKAQMRNSQLNALSSLMGEYKSQIQNNDDVTTRNNLNGVITAGIKIQEETQDLIRRKNLIVSKIEDILQDSGINLSE